MIKISMLKNIRNSLDGITDNRFVNEMIHGRNDYSKETKEELGKVGDDVIEGIEVIRTPVSEYLKMALNVVSMGEFNERLKKLPYDKLFHLAILFKTSKNVVMVHKQEVVNIVINPSIPSDAEEHTVQPKRITIKEFLKNGQRQMGVERFFDYDAWKNNCQDFIIGLLQGNGILSKQDEGFIKQDTYSLFENDKRLQRIARTTTEAGERANIFTNKIKYDVLKPSGKIAENLGKSNSKIIDGKDLKNDIKNKLLDNRIIKKINKTKESVDDTINYSMKPVEIGKYHTLPYPLPKHPPTMNGGAISDPSLAPRSRSIAGTGIRSVSEKVLIDRISKLGNHIQNHHRIHGGKIGIARAFKTLGSQVKDGFVDVEGLEDKAIDKAIDVGKSNSGKVKKYVTKQRGGLATDVIQYGLPAASAATLSALATAATGGNPAAGIAASAVGSKLGSMAAQKVLKATNTDVKGKGVAHKALRIGSSDNPVENIRLHEMEIISDNPLLSGLTTEDIKSLEHLKKLSGLKKRKEEVLLDKVRKSTRSRVERELKELKSKTQPKKERKGRLIKGSPEAMEWARKMKEARERKKK